MMGGPTMRSLREVAFQADEATALMYEAAERRYKEIDERHPYSGLVAGVGEVLRRLGEIDIDDDELTDWHNDLVGFANEFGNGRVVWGQIATAMDEGFFGTYKKPSSPLDYPFGDLAASRTPHGLRRADIDRVNLDWIANEMAKHLKSERIRRGTKKYQDFVKQNAEKVIDAATETTVRTMTDAIRSVNRSLAEAETISERANASLARARRHDEVRNAALRVADVAPNPAAAVHHAAYLADWEKAAANAGNLVQELANQRAVLEAGTNARDIAIGSMAWNDTLRPFLDAAGVSYALPAWKLQSIADSRAAEGSFASEGTYMARDSDWRDSVEASDGVYMYQADLYCRDDGKMIRAELDAAGKRPEDPGDEHSYDSDEYPKGPFYDESSDSPSHCAAGADCVNAIELPVGHKIGQWLGNGLTRDGADYTTDTVKEDLNSNSVYQTQVGRLWRKLFSDYLDNDIVGVVRASRGGDVVPASEAIKAIWAEGDPRLGISPNSSQKGIYCDLDNIYSFGFDSITRDLIALKYEAKPDGTFADAEVFRLSTADAISELGDATLDEAIKIITEKADWR